MPFANLIKKRRQGGGSAAVDTSKKPPVPSSSVCDKPPLEGLDQSGSRQPTRCSSKASVFAKSLEDVFSNPRLLSCFTEHLEKKRVAHYAQFVVEVDAFKASYADEEKQEGSGGGGGFSAIFRDHVVCSDSVDSFDSGIMSPGMDQKQQLPPPVATPPAASFKLLEEAAKKVQATAIGIYQRYIFPDSPSELSLLPRPVVQSVIQGICTGDGCDISPDCFDEASAFVRDTLKSGGHLQDFLDSTYYAKYQLEVLRPQDQLDGREGSWQQQLGVTDILTHEKLSSHLMEFMEVAGRGRGGRRLLEFWLNVNTITGGEGDIAAGGELTQADALLIYEKFVSMQAPAPIGFNNKIRCNIEEKICSGSGDTVSSDCFEEALSVVVSALDVQYLPGFLASPLFQNYILELETASQRRPRAGSTSSLTTTSSKSEFNSSIVSNTLLATSSHRSSTRQRQRHTNFLDFFNTDPCHLFKRKHNRLTNIGHVNHLGRYTSCVSRPPEGDKASGRAGKAAAADTVPMSRKLTHAMKRLVVSESEEQYREEMSWQMAELIVSEVLKLSKPSSS